MFATPDYSSTFDPAAKTDAADRVGINYRRLLFALRRVGRLIKRCHGIDQFAIRAPRGRYKFTPAVKGITREPLAVHL